MRRIRRRIIGVWLGNGGRRSESGSARAGEAELLLPCEGKEEGEVVLSVLIAFFVPCGLKFGG